jgi:hypothetical protein
MSSDSLEAMADEAQRACANGVVHNLLLSARLPVSSPLPFGGAWEDEALQWQAVRIPDRLHINHGSYIHAAGDAYEHVVEHLRQRPDGNRGIVSLLNMVDIVGSDERPIPSLMLMQFGRSRQTLYATAYFRALEVQKFLLVNLTEISIWGKRLASELPEIADVLVTILAFRAYARPETDLLHRAEIDSIPASDIGVAVIRSDTARVRGWLQGKMGDSTAIDTTGLDELVGVLQRHRDATRESFSDSFLACLREAVDALRHVQELRRKTSASPAVDRAYVDFRERLGDAVAEI